MGLNKFTTVGDYLSQTQSSTTDSTTGTAATNLVPATGTVTSTVVNNNFATVADRLGDISTDVGNLVSALNAAN